ncbi:phage terminase small subunit P27 family [Marinobacter algicola]|uniref:Phage terminase, small subunit, putative, P27 family protein n=1 Tax=Marinobacter algicola DG893 TaxID=443152 RepID=A6F0K5_9GAMM|nr:phage terminase small subunit P27 family [Marinobacter algicola]EDM47766.1 phage terminase, small subunit, putative, P27 family protein [Marinobacter algicola DG893]
MTNAAPVRASGGGRKQKTQSQHKSSLTRIAPPDELIDDMAVRIWKTQSKILIQRGTFELEDAPLLVAYCNSFAYMLQAEQEIAEQGLVVPTSDGSIKKSPFVGVRNDCIAQLTRTGSLLGLDPLTRLRMLGAGGSNGNGDSGVNEFDEFD